MSKQGLKAFLRPVLKFLDGLDKILGSSKFTLFWVGLLLVSGILGIVLKFMN